MHTHIHARTHTHIKHTTHTPTRAHAHTNTHTHTRTHTYIHTHTCTHAHTRTHTHTHAHTCMHTSCTHIDTHSHTHIHSCTHTSTGGAGNLNLSREQKDGILIGNLNAFSLFWHIIVCMEICIVTYLWVAKASKIPYLCRSCLQKSLSLVANLRRENYKKLCMSLGHHALLYMCMCL